MLGFHFNRDDIPLMISLIFNLIAFAYLVNESNHRAITTTAANKSPSLHTACAPVPSTPSVIDCAPACAELLNSPVLKPIIHIHPTPCPVCPKKRHLASMTMDHAMPGIECTTCCKWLRVLLSVDETPLLPYYLPSSAAIPDLNPWRVKNAHLFTDSYSFPFPSLVTPGLSTSVTEIPYHNQDDDEFELDPPLKAFSETIRQTTNTSTQPSPRLASYVPFGQLSAPQKTAPCPHYFMVRTAPAAGLGHKSENIMMGLYWATQWNFTYVFPGYETDPNGPHGHEVYSQADMALFGKYTLPGDITYDDLKASIAAGLIIEEEIPRVGDDPNNKEPDPFKAEAVFAQYYRTHFEARVKDASTCNRLFIMPEMFYYPQEPFIWTHFWQRLRQTWLGLAEAQAKGKLPPQVAQALQLKAGYEAIHSPETMHIGIHIRQGDFVWNKISMPMEFALYTLGLVLRLLMDVPVDIWLSCEEDCTEAEKRVDEYSSSWGVSVHSLPIGLTYLETLNHFSRLDFFIGTLTSSFSQIFWTINPSAVPLFHNENGRHVSVHPAHMVKSIRFKKETWKIKQKWNKKRLHK